MTRRNLSSVLATLDACAESREWAAAYGSAWSTALAACAERRWLTWLAGVLMCRGHLRREVIVRCACACARTALQYVPAGEERPLRAIEAAEAWTRGEATLDDVRRARQGARDAADAADAAYAAYAADAADAADAAADAYAADAADAADAAADAAAYAAAAAAAAAAYAAAAAAAYAADARREARARAEADLLAITRRELGAALLDGLTAYAATLPEVSE